MSTFSKVEQLQQRMRERNLSVAVLRLVENVVMFSHYWPRNGISFLVIPVEGAPRLMVPHVDEEAARQSLITDISIFGWSRLSDGNPWQAVGKLLEQFAADRNIPPNASVGIERGFEVTSPSLCSGEMMLPGVETQEMIATAFHTSQLIPIISDLTQIRSLKNEIEITRLDLANKIAKAALLNLQPLIRPGITEIELPCQLEADVALTAARTESASSGRAWAQVLSGERTALGYFPGHASLNRPIQEGDFVMIELAVVVDGFWADLTRTYVCGTPTAQQQKMLDVTHQAQTCALAEIRDGVSAASVDQCARKIMDQNGWLEHFVHHTGHGVGFRYHESIPFLAPQSSDILQAGMVLTLEPGVYLPGVGGVRIEDNAVVTTHGARILAEKC